ncbi:MAG: hypothetical protein INR72_02345 [Williamsia herbipolensis]|uniref:Uncharacterized protein n=1 Tax=Williamsia serinedens TaxID=391736 RepID=A0ABT1H5N9_9NOCA|nr:hypothetical protein [Williamsia serinedens]MBE7160060.1 hypothetical protein [Williamsia herbipolensis]MCP2162553.1 hypothetical protein [Williamsia serinedens]
MDSSGADGRRDAADTDPLRALVLALLDRVENFATTVIGENVEVRDPARPPVDMGPAVRAAVDAIVVEITELVNRVLTALIAALQAISAALDEVGGDRGRRTRVRTDGRGPAGRGGSFQPITVEVHPT